MSRDCQPVSVFLCTFPLLSAKTLFSAWAGVLLSMVETPGVVAGLADGRADGKAAGLVAGPAAGLVAGLAAGLTPGLFL